MGCTGADEGATSYLKKDVGGQAEQTEDVPLIPGVHHAQHLGYVLSAVLQHAAVRLLSE